jgi:hypothetical protein
MTKINLYTPLEDIPKQDIVMISKNALEWAIRNLGGKRMNNKQPLRLRYRWNVKKWSGEYIYKSNTIFVYPNGQRNVRDLIDTIIHEFIHHKQCMKRYKRLLKRKGYKDHPMEEEAIWFARMYRTPCWLSIKNKINK